MSTYLIGDVQGCYDALQSLLRLIEFDPTKDTLGFVGDLVNRGPQSLETLRFIRSLPSSHVVLGNHDLYCLILGYGLMPIDSYEHTLHEIMNAPDKTEILNWLREQPLIYHDVEKNFLLVHAGLPPQWTIEESVAYGKEVSDVLRSAHFNDFLSNLFGNEPISWTSNLTGQDRLRYMTNCFTRLRFCDEKGNLDLTNTRKNHDNHSIFKPWFEFRNSKKDNVDIAFGHWAALGGHCDAPRCYALDTGCVWGHSLTAIRVEDKQRFSIPCST